MSTQSLTLYQLEGELTELLTLLDADAGEDEATVLHVLDDIAEKHEAAVDKRDRTIQFLRSLKASIAFHKEEESRIRKRRQGLEKGLKRTEDYVIDLVDEHGTVPHGKKSKCLEGRVGTLAIQPNPSSVVVEDGGAVPRDLVRATFNVPGEAIGLVNEALAGIEYTWEIHPMKAAIKRALEARQAAEAKLLQEPIEDAAFAAKKMDELPREVAGADLVMGGYSLRIR